VTDESQDLDELLRRTPDTDRETPSSVLDQPTDQDFWGFADTFKRLPRLNRVEEVTPAPRLKLIETQVVQEKRPPTPPRIPIPPVLHAASSSPELTPLPRAWNSGDLLFVVLVALAMSAVGIILMVR
jgi:hypothetical protein